MSPVKFEKIKRPETIRLPFMLDFYPLQEEKNTKTSQFFKNLGEGRLTTTKCNNCGKLLWPPRIICSECLSENLAWVDLDIEGELYAFTEVRLGAPIGFEKDVPFCVGIVKIGDLLITARVDDATYDDLEIGDKVSLKIVKLEDSRVFFRFFKCNE